MMFDKKHLTPLVIAVVVLLAVITVSSKRSSRIQDDAVLDYSEEDMQARLDEAIMTLEAAALEYWSRAQSLLASNENYKRQVERQSQVNLQVSLIPVPGGAPLAVTQPPDYPRLAAEFEQARERFAIALKNFGKVTLQAKVTNAKRYFSLHVPTLDERSQMAAELLANELNVPADWYLKPEAAE